MQTGRNGTPCYTNWAIETLPYVEQENLYKRYDQKVFNEHANNRFVNQSRVPVHECLSDQLAGKLERPTTGQARYDYMHGSYRAVSGRSGAIGRGFWDTFEDQFWPPNWVMLQSWRGALHGTATAYNGIPAQNATGQKGSQLSQMGGPEKFASIIDGTSNTLFIGEYTNLGNSHPQVDGNRLTSRRATFWSYTYASYNQSSVTTESRILGNDYVKCTLTRPDRAATTPASAASAVSTSTA